MTTIHLAHAEAAANTIAGLVLIQAMLWAFGIPIILAWKLNITALVISYVRSFVLRLIFMRWAAR